nr:hypothetical protein [Tanacetum cinerariifolium]
MVAAFKVSMLKPGEYEIWRMRFELYIHMIDYALWEVIENGETFLKTQVVEGVTTEVPITTAKEKAQRRLEDTYVVGWRNKVDLDTMSMDDLYNNLKVYEPEVKGMSSSSSNTQNMAFVSFSNNNTSTTNGTVNTTQAVNTTHRVSTVITQVNTAHYTNIDNLSDAAICSFFASQPNSPQLIHEDLEQIHPDDIKEMYLRWQMAMLTIRARRAPRNQDNKYKESSRRSVHVETSTSTALVSCDGLGGYDWSDQAEEGPNYALMAFSSLSSGSEDQRVIDSRCSRYMIENMSYLTDYKEIDEGYVAFGGNPKRRENHKKKADEGFFVGSSLNSKALRVFNSRTRIIEENLHIRFNESIPNVVGSGPDWLFDIDALTRIINYEPIVAGTQSNGFISSKESDNAGQARKETEPIIDYILLPLWTVDPPFSQDPKSSHDDGSKPSSDDEKKVDEDQRKENECNDQEKEYNVNNTTNKEPKEVIHTLKDPRWIEAMQEELLQFKLQEVWTLVDLPNRKRAIGTKWVFKNKKDKRGIVIRNKARLVTQGKIEKEVYVCQLPGFEDPDFHDRVYKKFGFIEVKTASTPMEKQKPLLKDEDGKEVDVHMYRSMIGSLMYLTSLRLDIMFVVCACARYQVNPKISHLYDVKRIFRYLSPSVPTDNVVDEAIHKELGNSLVRAATTACSLEAKQDHAKIDVDYQLAERLQAQEQEEFSDVEKATLFQQLLEKRRKHFVAKIAKEKRNKPPTKSQQRKIMCTYLKNMEGYKLKDLKLKEFDRIQEMSDKAFKRKQKVEDDKEKAKLKQLMETMLNEEEVEIDAIPLVFKSLKIVDMKIQKEGKKSYYQIVRADGKSQRSVVKCLKFLTRKI